MFLFQIENHSCYTLTALWLYIKKYELHLVLLINKLIRQYKIFIRVPHIVLSAIHLSQICCCCISLRKTGQNAKQ